VDRDRKQQVRLATDDRVFRVVQTRMFRLQSIGAGTIAFLVVASTWGDWPRFVLAVVLHGLLFPFNMAFDRLVVDRIGSRAEIYRHLINQSITGVGYIWLGWPMAAWMWLPFTALTIDESAGRRGLHVVIMVCAMASAAALVAGVPWFMPILVSVFTLICWEFTRARGEIIREMLIAAEKQRDDLARTEMELRHAQKLEAIGRLAAGVAHEINTPMQFVSDNLKFVTESAGELLAVAKECASPEQAQAADLAYLDENVPAALEHARVGVQRVASIVRSMKEFAHPGGAESGPVDLNAAIMNTLTISRYEYKLVADVETHLGDIPTIEGNGGELNQVLLNLVVNAAHAIGDVVAKRTMDRGLITVSSRVQDDHVVIDISDTGGGIRESLKMKVFEPFFTTKAVGRGTGQGLAIARAVVERHAGTLHFASAIGKGTTFTIRLPITAAREPHRELSAA
jgi:signal transduction histidine kinase